MNYYWIAFGGAMVAVLVGTPLVGWIARRLGLVDMPNARKIHRKPIPRMGGVAIFVATMAAATVTLTEFREEWAIDAAMYTRLMIALGAAGCVFVIGVLDDLCGISSKTKLTGIFLAAAAVCISGTRLDTIVLGEGMRLNLGWMGWPVAMLWIAGVTVSMNFIDGLDGLAAGMAAIVCGALATMAYLIYEPMMMVLPLAMMGSLAGFLVFNFNPARIFMGDSGSMFIGFLVGVCSLMNMGQGKHAGELLFPALILGIPIIDTTLTMIRRSVLMRRSLFSAERGHIHHRLIDLGLSQRQVVMALCGVTLLCAVSGMVMLIDPKISWKVGGLCILILGMVFRLAGSIRFWEIMDAIVRNRKLRQQKTSDQQRFEEMQLRFNVALNFDAWWHEVCAAAEMMEFLRVYLPLQDRNGNTRVLAWTRPGDEREMHDYISAEIPIRQRRAGNALRAKVVVGVNGSLENAGQRMSLFTRLMEEHSLGSLPRETNPWNQRVIATRHVETVKPELEIDHGNGNGLGHATHGAADKWQ